MQILDTALKRIRKLAKILSEMIKKKALDPKILQRKIKGKNVIVIGAGPSLEDEKVTKIH